MANDITPYQSDGGDVAPYAPSPLQPLAPSPETWGNVPDVLTPKEIYQQQSGSQVRLFGEALPIGATPQQLQQVLGEIAGLFMGDMSRLSHPAPVINTAISWFQNSAMQPVRQEQKNHRYNLHDQAHDPVANSFGNAMAKVNASQEFISNSLWWLGELNKKLGASRGKPAQGSAPNSDAEWDRLERKALVDKQRCENELRNRWGREYETRLRVLTHYYANLPQREKDHFEGALLPGDVAALNSPELLEKIYFQALGIHSIPQGSALQSEIDQITELIRINRRAYNNDEALQQRFRYLLELRGDGR